MLARTTHARTSPLRVLLLAALAAVTLGSVLAAAACADEDETTGGDVTPITFMAGFRPQANLAFVAVYVAVEQGFYADEGLEVNVQHSSGQDEHLKLLLDGEIDFTTGTAAHSAISTTLRCRFCCEPHRVQGMIGKFLMLENSDKSSSAT